MEAVDMERKSLHYCFPLRNSSCIKLLRPQSQYISLYLVLSIISWLTVILNLLVIVSISHYRKLHTPTNLLILSLAVADFLVGLIIIPVESITYIETCWYFGNAFCAVFPVILYIVIVASLSNLVLISIDRYIAVIHPLLYPLIVTAQRTAICIICFWTFSLLYILAILYNHITNPEMHGICLGQCELYINFIWAVIDLFAGFVFPCSVIIYLYLRICCVAAHQSKALRTKVAGPQPDELRISRQKSENKAVRTLGIVIAVYLLCWIPYYICLLCQEYIASSAVVLKSVLLSLYTSSCTNPMIYAFFYPWFRKAVKNLTNQLILKFIYLCNNCKYS